MTDTRTEHTPGWTWWVGTAESVDQDGNYNIDECRTREEAIKAGLRDTLPGDAFYIIEAIACDREPEADEDSIMPFLDSRNREKIVNGDPA